MRPSTKFVLDMIREHRREMLVIVAIATVGAVLATIVPYVYGKLFDLAQVPSTPVSLLLALIGIWLLMSLISAYTSNKTGLLGEVLGAKMSLKAEVDAYSHFLTLPVLFHKREQRGEVLQKITRGAWRLQNMVESLADVLPRLLMFAFSVVAMSLIEWKLALLLLLSFLIYGLVTVRMTEEVLKARRREHKVFEKQYGKVYDKLYNVFLVKNFVMEDKEKDRFTKALIHKTLPALKESSAKSARLSILQGVIYSVAFVSVLGTAIFFLRHGNISAGEFVMFFGYVNLAFGPFRFLAALYRHYRRSVLAISRFVRLKRIAPEVMKHGKKTLPNLRGEIEFENLSFSYVRGKYVLKDI
ncbi:ABC transporter ATP-binding protein, partial [Candidatus Pacearchaeota archaeon]